MHHGRTFRVAHLRAARAFAEMLWEALATLVRTELALSTVARRLMLGVSTPHVTGCLLAACIVIATRFFRATGMFIVRT